ncbi:hypothetical protein [Mesorhizobium sp. M1399]|uniref:hypothetical protein n=1 Tax=Mesorhizobium sp. M1399 TaxID=2957096 RepID=UPI003339C2A7
MMKDLAEIAHVEILPAYWTMLEMLRLGLDQSEQARIPQTGADLELFGSACARTSKSP